MASRRPEKNLNPAITRYAGKIAFIWSIFLFIAISLCYYFRPDSCAAITFFPTWLWAAIGLALALPLLFLGRKIFLAAIAAWLLFTFVFAEEPICLVRQLFLPSATSKKAGTLRVVSLNCAGGNPQAAEEVVPYQPDIVLLQEAPSKKDVESLGQRLFGDEAALAWNFDPVIIAHGHLQQRSLPRLRSLIMTEAYVTMPNGLAVEVISLRLTPPSIGLNIFSPSNWKEHTNTRKLRRAQVASVVEQISAISHGTPVILGGDFNAPAGDAAVALLEPYLCDTVKQAGIGWPNTAINTLPLQRIDQIWTSKHFKVVSVWAAKTKNSDHRLVVCDLVSR